MNQRGVFNPFEQRRQREERQHQRILQNTLEKTIKRIQETDELDGLSYTIIGMMNDNETDFFIDKITSFIIKWVHLMNDSESNSLSRIKNFFFSDDLINFHIVFLSVIDVTFILLH